MFSHTPSWGRIACAIAVAIFATAIGIPASHAQVVSIESDVPTVSVKYSDLNLATEHGSRVLYNRLETAAQRVCPRVGYVTELRRNRDARDCITASVERAAKQIQSPKFAEVAASKLR